MIPAVSCSPQTCLLAVLMLFTVPVRWILAAVSAGIYHELCHLVMIRGTGGMVTEWKIRMMGMELQTLPMEPVQELLCAAAGPAGSLSMWFVYPWFPELAICGVIQGVYNLLPVYPLDGGRIVSCLLRLFLPWETTQLLLRIMNTAVSILLFICLAAISVWSNWPVPAVFGILFLRKFCFRKKSCNAGLLGVQ